MLSFKRFPKLEFSELLWDKAVEGAFLVWDESYWSPQMNFIDLTSGLHFLTRVEVLCDMSFRLIYEIPGAENISALHRALQASKWRGQQLELQGKCWGPWCLRVLPPGERVPFILCRSLSQKVTIFRSGCSAGAKTTQQSLITALWPGMDCKVQFWSSFFPGASLDRHVFTDSWPSQYTALQRSHVRELSCVHASNKNARQLKRHVRLKYFAWNVKKSKYLRSGGVFPSWANLLSDFAAEILDASLSKQPVHEPCKSMDDNNCVLEWSSYFTELNARFSCSFCMSIAWEWSRVISFSRGVRSAAPQCAAAPQLRRCATDRCHAHWPAALAWKPPFATLGGKSQREIRRVCSWEFGQLFFEENDPVIPPFFGAWEIGLFDICVPLVAICLQSYARQRPFNEL